MKTKPSHCYSLHPVLTRFYDEWSQYGGGSGLISGAANWLQTAAVPAVIYYREVDVLEEGKTVTKMQIIGPVLPLFSWQTPTAPPAGFHLVRLALDDDEICRLAIAEWIRLMHQSGDRLIIERVRKMFQTVFDAEQRVRWLDDRHISQTYWAQSLGLSRSQLARGAQASRRLMLADSASCRQAEEPAFFSEYLGDAK